jgi:predicted alpha/beta superfamily hydrolase
MRRTEKVKKNSRREFLQASLLAAAGTVTAACAKTTKDQDEPQYPPVTLDNTEVRTLVSKAVEDMEYKILVAFPDQYDESSGSYPALYCLDAYAQFGILTETYRYLSFSGEIRPLLLVGISYECTRDENIYYRARDYLPSHIPPEKLGAAAKFAPASGGASNFVRFIRDELIPFVEREYRVDPTDRGLFGHSYGGTFAAWVLFNHSELFQRYLLGSPALGWDDGLVLKHEEAYAEHNSALPAKVFASVGSLEQTMPWTTLKEQLESRNYEGLEFTATEFKRETHMSGIPATHSRALRVLYGR